jgi:hypothetical protein
MAESAGIVLDSALRAWQARDALLAVSCSGHGMSVAFSGRIRSSKRGTWAIGNGRVGIIFDVTYATGGPSDPNAVPERIRACIDGDFVSALDIFLETGDECWLGELRI